MSDTATIPTVEEQTEITAFEKTAKRGFDLEARLKNRGLRKGTITLFLDEEKGPELGWAFDATDFMGNKTGQRVREGVEGELDAAAELKAGIIAAYDRLIEAWEARCRALAEEREQKTAPGEAPKVVENDPERPTEPDFTDLDASVAKLEEQRDELTAELTKTAIVVKMRAVPPVIEKDCRRKARAEMGITEKNVPEAQKEEFGEVFTKHLFTVLFQSIHDNLTDEDIFETTLDDAQLLIDQLPKGQFARLDAKIGEVQFTDAISRRLEGQEDFS